MSDSKHETAPGTPIETLDGTIQYREFTDEHGDNELQDVTILPAGVRRKIAVDRDALLYDGKQAKVFAVIEGDSKEAKTFKTCEILGPSEFVMGEETYWRCGKQEGRPALFLVTAAALRVS